MMKEESISGGEVENSNVGLQSWCSAYFKAGKSERGGEAIGAGGLATPNER